MKKKEIGQCKDCYFYKEGRFTKRTMFCEQGDYNTPMSPKATFGCWYWEEKKK